MTPTPDREARILWGALAVSAALHAGVAMLPGPGREARPGPGAVPIPVSMLTVGETPVAAPAEIPPDVPAPVPEAPARPAAPAATGVPDDGWSPAAPAAPAAPGGGVDGGGDDARFRPPRLLVGALPLSAEDWEDLGISGDLEIPVRLQIGVDGRVVRIEPVDPDLDPRLRVAVERSAEAMRFVPAALDERPVPAWFTMTFVSRKAP